MRKLFLTIFLISSVIFMVISANASKAKTKQFFLYFTPSLHESALSITQIDLYLTGQTKAPAWEWGPVYSSYDNGWMTFYTSMSGALNPGWTRSGDGTTHITWAGASGVNQYKRDLYGTGVWVGTYFDTIVFKYNKAGNFIDTIHDWTIALTGYSGSVTMTATYWGTDWAGKAGYDTWYIYIRSSGDEDIECPSITLDIAALLVSPEDGATVSTTSPDFRTRPVTLDEAHTKTEWKIGTTLTSGLVEDDDLVYLLESRTVLTRLNHLPDFVLDPGTTYYWAVKYYNGCTWTGWSDARSFTTSSDPDPDIVYPVYTGALPIPTTVVSTEIVTITIDSDDSNVTMQAGKYVDVNEATGQEGRPLLEAKQANNRGYLPFGLVSFELTVTTGATVDVTVSFSEEPLKGPDMKWYKYNPADGKWKVHNGADFADDRKSVTLTLTDGGDGDADGVANGKIVDPSGLWIKERWRAAWGPDGARHDNPDYFPVMENNGYCFINTAASGLQ